MPLIFFCVKKLKIYKNGLSIADLIFYLCNNKCAVGGEMKLIVERNIQNRRSNNESKILQRQKVYVVGI